MIPDINLHHEIPQEVKDAALLLGNYFKKQGIDSWALYDVSSRQNFNGAYNQGLDTAINLVSEGSDMETVICGLENSKKQFSNKGGDGIDYTKSF
jgi:uncharacterized protein (DUF2164 family)